MDLEHGVSTRVDINTLKKLKALAKVEMRPMSNMIRVLILEALKSREQGGDSE